MSYDDSNIFAKILRGEIPATKVYEDQDFVVFMDVMPQAPGHTLVVPKAASRNILDADPAVLAKLLAFDAEGCPRGEDGLLRRRRYHHRSSTSRPADRPCSTCTCTSFRVWMATPSKRLMPAAWKIPPC